MPNIVPPVADEREGLLKYLAQQRFSFRAVAHGLTEEQASSTPCTSALSIAGLVKHLAGVEHSWMASVVAQREPYPSMEEVDWEWQFKLKEGETLAGMLARYDEVARQTEAIVAEYPDLGHPVPVPQGVPWFPSDVENWSVRWVLLTLIQETARHAGHADIIRETIDGKTMYELIDEHDAHHATAAGNS